MHERCMGDNYRTLLDTAMELGSLSRFLGFPVTVCGPQHSLLVPLSLDTVVRSPSYYVSLNERSTVSVAAECDAEARSASDERGNLIELSSQSHHILWTELLLVLKRHSRLLLLVKSGHLLRLSDSTRPADEAKYHGKLR